jgi:hypothetical protein
LTPKKPNRFLMQREDGKVSTFPIFENLGEALVFLRKANTPRIYECIVEMEDRSGRRHKFKHEITLHEVYNQFTVKHWRSPDDWTEWFNSDRTDPEPPYQKITFVAVYDVERDECVERFDGEVWQNIVAARTMRGMAERERNKRLVKQMLIFMASWAVLVASLYLALSIPGAVAGVALGLMLSSLFPSIHAIGENAAEARFLLERE